MQILSVQRARQMLVEGLYKAMANGKITRQGQFRCQSGRVVQMLVGRLNLVPMARSLVSSGADQGMAANDSWCGPATPVQ